jgi:single-strand DNA-binding protein
MSSINKVIIIGNLGRDPELRETKAGAVCKLSIATTHTWKDKSGAKKEDTEWHRVTVWGKQAEHCAQYLAKGRSCYVEGRLKTTSYEKDGVKRYSTDIVASTVQFLGGRSEGGGQRSEKPAPYDAGGYGTPPGDDGIPF